MKKYKILIADDDRCLRTALRTRLNSMGYRVVESPDGLGALSQCIPEDVDAMILDYDMPDCDGQSVARMIRNESDVPILFLSGHAPEKFLAIVTQLPDVYYMRKPVNSEKLEMLLEQVIETSELVAM